MELTRVTGNLNAKVARVEVELPNGRKGKGLARLMDLQQRAESADNDVRDPNPDHPVNPVRKNLRGKLFFD
ncbi:MAG: hypothetical protein IJS32_06880 [Kiritimatiellae bacterium]|nr:hypothetical protein [Kiritimatiellia bacterium]